MSWDTINQILGLATLDDDFCQALLLHPLSAIQQQGFQLTQSESEVIEQVSASTLCEFSRLVSARLAPEKATDQTSPREDP